MIPFSIICILRVEDKTIQNDTMNFIRTWLEKHFPETKFILVPEIKF